MLLDVRDLRESDARVERAYPPAAFPASDTDDYRVSAPVTLSFRVRADGDKYWLQGTILTAVEHVCGRCLASFEVALTLDIDLRYLPQQVNTGDGELEISEDDLTTAFYRDDRIDLGALVREQLQLVSPMKPLCRDGCRGLCPVCGVDRNAETCDCDARWRDPRLEALRSLVAPDAPDRAGGSATGATGKDEQYGEPQTTAFEGADGKAAGPRRTDPRRPE